MTVVVHLSDLHMGKDPRAQGPLFDKLVETLRDERQKTMGNAERLVVVVTGDVFDSATDPAEKLIESFLVLQARVVQALGGDIPTVVIPGNHDRRRLGLLGPHREGLFRKLRAAVDPRRVYVAGGHTPFLAQIVPQEMHGIDGHLITYDSSYLPQGWVGAGGTIRLEDLLQVHARLPDDGRMLVVLVHHHLIPTPITDVSHVESVGAPRLTRWLVGTALPAVVSNADREELTMTALGAGTALSTLHSFGRAVLLLHGHKHVPTARLLHGMADGSGDILLAAAGSAGRRERVHATRDPDAVRLWPSFNLVRLEGDQVHIESVSYSPKRNTRPPMRRDLARIRRAGPQWHAEPVSLGVQDPAPRVDLDEADFAVSPARTNVERWDLVCERLVRLRPGARLRRYVDFVHALPAALPHRKTRRRANPRVELRIGEITHYHVPDSLCRTLDEGRRSYGVGTAFEWVGLLCRYGAAHATLRLSRRWMEGVEPFGSLTDLTTGRERPLVVDARPNQWIVTADGCAPRSLLRLYWPLADR
jgi:3',5'-cyclic AMP phosphodiesterase CpdA